MNTLQSFRLGLVSRIAVAIFLLMSLFGPTNLAQVVSSQSPDPIPVTIFSDTYVRNTEKLQQFIRTITIPQEVHGPFTLTAFNGNEDGSNRVQKAKVKLDRVFIFGNYDFNQTIYERSKPVELTEGMVLDIKLLSAPGAFLKVEISGFVDPDQRIETRTQTIGRDGGTILVPDVGSLYIPPEAVESAEIQIATVQSPYMNFVRQSMDLDFVPLDVPQIWLKSSAHPSLPIHLRMVVPNLDTAIPQDHVPTFAVMIFEPESEYAETDIINIDGYMCGDESLCVEISPEHFSVTNPLDPLDPVVWVQGGYTPRPQYYLWNAANITPDYSAVTVLPQQSIPVTGYFNLDTHIYLNHPLNGAGSITSRFYEISALRRYRPHYGIDLAIDPGTPVEAATWGMATQGDDGVNTGCGKYVKMTHAEGWTSKYCHLEKQGPYINPVFGGVEIGKSGSTGHSTNPHLHFELRWNNQPINPYPLITNQPDLFWSDPEFPLELRVLLEPTEPWNQSAPIITMASETVTSQAHYFNKMISFNNVPPGIYHMYLQMSSVQLGGNHVLKTWLVTVTNPSVLTISKIGEGSVVSVPNGIECDPNCQAQFDLGTPVTLYASPNSGFEFKGWEGDCTPIPPTSLVTMITMDGDKWCNAIFEPIIDGEVLAPSNSSHYEFIIYTVPMDVNYATITATVSWASDWYLPPPSQGTSSFVNLVEMPYQGGYGCDFIRNYPQNNFVEFESGMDPTNPNSVKVSSIDVDPGKSVAIAGSDCYFGDNFTFHRLVRWSVTLYR